MSPLWLSTGHHDRGNWWSDYISRGLHRLPRVNKLRIDKAAARGIDDHEIMTAQQQ